MDCTRVKNTKCKCKENFTPWDDDHSTCKCDKGYGLNTDRGTELDHNIRSCTEHTGEVVFLISDSFFFFFFQKENVKNVKKDFSPRLMTRTVKNGKSMYSSVVATANAV